MPTFNADRLQALTAAIFEKTGATADAAQVVAEHLVEANLTGHDSHGVLRVLQYIELIDGGTLKPQGRAEVVHETSAIAVLDGGGGFGQVVAREAMLRAIEKARACGIGAATARHCSHTGRIGTYTCMAAEAGMVGIAVVNSGGGGHLVAPFGGTQRRLSTNPISIAAPGPGGQTIMLDAATSVAPEGKVRNLHQAGKSAPTGWMIDASGRPTVNTADFYDEPGGALLPLGDAVGHKGYALAFMVDILAGALGGAGCCQAVPPPPADGMLAIALDIAQFTPPEAFDQRVAALVEHVKSSSLAPGVEQILVPGEPEAIKRKKRLREGIFVEPFVWAKMQEICDRFGLDAPSPRD
jgi:hydroxycarboxylate dehydrogenase B